VQYSTGSQAPVLARQDIDALTNESAGHAADDPVQVSGRSHTPALGRQTLVKKLSAGQPTAAPVQVSATSQTPAEARQVVAGVNS
jgi:hypothetical protein